MYNTYKCIQTTTTLNNHGDSQKNEINTIGSAGRRRHFKFCILRRRRTLQVARRTKVTKETYPLEKRKRGRKKKEKKKKGKKKQNGREIFQSINIQFDFQ